MKEHRKIEWANYDLLCIIRYILRHFWMVPVATLVAVMVVYLFFSIAITPSDTSSVTFAVTVIVPV